VRECRNDRFRNDVHTIAGGNAVSLSFQDLTSIINLDDHWLTGKARESIQIQFAEGHICRRFK
jgi:hypothetical protein